MNPNLLIKKTPQQLREVQSLAQNHTAEKWQTWAWIWACLAPMLLTIVLCRFLNDQLFEKP